jgi:hypothetical protein
MALVNLISKEAPSNGFTVEGKELLSRVLAF